MNNRNLKDRWNNIVYLWTGGYLKMVPDNIKNIISPEKVYKRLVLILKYLIADFLKLFKKDNIPEKKIWFLVFSKNNIDSLKNIKQGIPNSVYVTFFRFNSKLNIKTYYFSLRFRFLYDFIFPIYWFRYYQTNRLKALRCIDLLFLVNGSYEESLRLLKRKKPQALVFSNDHMIIPRALLLAAKKLGIKTYYIQHASVTSYFPPLEFTYALLEGEDALNKYKICGPVESKVFLIGMPKFDSYSESYNKNSRLKNIGVAYNLIDEIDSLYKFLLQLQLSNPEIKIIVRPHPSDDRILPNMEKIEFSDSKFESSFEFLNKIDCLISGSSSIHLEAVLLNVYPCYYDFGEKKNFDSYKYVENGMVEYFEYFEHLNTKIEELKNFKPNIQYKAKYYNSSLESDFYGKSSSKSIEIILETLKL